MTVETVFAQQPTAPLSIGQRLSPAGGVEIVGVDLSQPLTGDLPAAIRRALLDRPGDVVMWDNRALLHRALANYEMGRHRRVLHRTVVRGTVPY